MISCPSCQSVHYKKQSCFTVLTDSTDRLFDAGFDLFECLDCYLWYKSPMPSHLQLMDYYQKIKTDNNPWVNAVRYPHERKIDKIIHKLPSSAKILDVGCFTGKLYSTHQRHTLYGIEPSKEAAAIASSINNIKIIESEVTEEIVEKYEDFFDLITLVDVFEHLRDPTKYIFSLYRMLKSNGQLVITTGRTDSATVKIIGSTYWYFYIDSHLVFLNKKYLQQLDLQNFTLRYYKTRHFITNPKLIIKELLWSFIWLYLTPNNVNNRKKLPDRFRKYFSRFKAPITLTFPRDHALAVIKKMQ